MTDKTETSNPIEFSRPFSIERLNSHSEIKHSIKATEEEREKLCERFQIKGIEVFEAKFILSITDEPNTYEAYGELNATVKQDCQVTKQEVQENVSCPLHVYFKPEKDVEMLLDPAASDDRDIEPIDHGMIDLGEISTQYLSLAMNDCPTAENFSVTYDESVLEDEPTKQPFAELAKLKDHIANDG